MGKRDGKANPVSIFLALVLAAAVYLSWKYIPVMYTKNELSNIVREATFTANRTSDDQIRKTLIEAARLDFGVDLKGEDIEVIHYSDRVRIRLIWRPTIALGFGKSIQHVIEISESATTY
jgi:hypothetical protein